MWRELRSELTLDLPIERVFEFFSRAENLERITPRNLGFRILTPTPIEMWRDTVIDYSIRLHGIPMRWRTLIPVWNPPFEFVDEQIRGPYKSWIHRHTFESLESGRTRIRDHVRYELPMTPISEFVYPLVRRQVEGIFEHRNLEIPRALAADAASASPAASSLS